MTESTPKSSANIARIVSCNVRLSVSPPILLDYIYRTDNREYYHTNQ